jgi:hypothetical protein
MALINDVQKLREDLRALREQENATRDAVHRHEEQISGDRGLSVAITQLADEVKSMRRAMWTVGAGIVVSAVGFAFSVLTLVG